MSYAFISRAECWRAVQKQVKTAKKNARQFMDDRSSLHVNSLLCVASIGPPVMVYCKLLDENFLFMMFLVGIPICAALSSLIFFASVEKAELLKCSVHVFEGTALNALAQLELGRIWLFPATHSWKIDGVRWITASNKYGFDIGAAFEATKNFPYLILGFVCLMGVYLGTTGDFGPGSKILLSANVNKLFAEVFATLVAAWTSTVSLYLGFNRLLFKLKMKKG